MSQKDSAQDFVRTKIIDGKKYYITVSKYKDKKYDVYNKDGYLLSFGNIKYEQYKDKFGFYSHLDHNDKERRDKYQKRFLHLYKNDPTTATYWGYNFLW